jgi:RimJ/RimL family protein N-acetyltransferase
MIKALINFGYLNGGRKITADVAQENAGSNAVLKKLGFYVEKEGSFKKRETDIVYDEYTYRLDLE